MKKLLFFYLLFMIFVSILMDSVKTLILSCTGLLLYMIYSYFVDIYEKLEKIEKTMNNESEI